MANQKSLTVFLYDGTNFKGKGNIDGSVMTIKQLKQEYIDKVLCIDSTIGKPTVDSLLFYNHGVPKDNQISTDNPQLLSNDSTLHNCGILNESVIVVKYVPIQIKIGVIKKDKLVPERFHPLEVDPMMTFQQLVQMCIKQGIVSGSYFDIKGNAGIPLNPSASLSTYGFSNGSCMFLYELAVEQKEEEIVEYANASKSVEDAPKEADMNEEIDEQANISKSDEHVLKQAELEQSTITNSQ